MNNNDTLTEIEGFAYSYLTKKEISIILLHSVEVADLCDEQSPEGLAFLKGRLRRKAEYNNEIIKLSKQLSSPAMALEAKIAEQSLIQDQKDETYR